MQVRLYRKLDATKIPEQKRHVHPSLSIIEKIIKKVILHTSENQKGSKPCKRTRY